MKPKTPVKKGTYPKNIYKLMDRAAESFLPVKKVVMLPCYKCKARKPESEFQKDRSRGSGYMSKCRACNLKRVSDITPAKYQRRKQKIISYQSNWQKNNKEKKYAHVLVRLAIKSGKLKRQPCQNCGVTKVHGHHSDYSKPLDVIWLCSHHHKLLHLSLPKSKK